MADNHQHRTPVSLDEPPNKKSRTEAPVVDPQQNEEHPWVAKWRQQECIEAPLQLFSSPFNSSLEDQIKGMFPPSQRPSIERCALTILMRTADRIAHYVLFCAYHDPQIENLALWLPSALHSFTQNSIHHVNEKVLKIPEVRPFSLKNAVRWITDFSQGLLLASISTSACSTDRLQVLGSEMQLERLVAIVYSLLKWMLMRDTQWVYHANAFTSHKLYLLQQRQENERKVLWRFFSVDWTLNEANMMTASNIPQLVTSGTCLKPITPEQYATRWLENQFVSTTREQIQCNSSSWYITMDLKALQDQGRLAARGQWQHVELEETLRKWNVTPVRFLGVARESCSLLPSKISYHSRSCAIVRVRDTADEDWHFLCVVGDSSNTEYELFDLNHLRPDGSFLRVYSQQGGTYLSGTLHNDCTFQSIPASGDGAKLIECASEFQSLLSVNPFQDIVQDQWALRETLNKLTTRRTSQHLEQVLDVTSKLMCRASIAPTYWSFNQPLAIRTKFTAAFLDECMRQLEPVFSLETFPLVVSDIIAQYAPLERIPYNSTAASQQYEHFSRLRREKFEADREAEGSYYEMCEYDPCG